MEHTAVTALLQAAHDLARMAQRQHNEIGEVGEAVVRFEQARDALVARGFTPPRDPTPEERAALLAGIRRTLGVPDPEPRIVLDDSGRAILAAFDRRTE